MTSKAFYESKTFWFGFAQILIGFGTALQSFLTQGDFSLMSVGMFLMGIITIILRAVTEKPISLS